jgi:hypothetical protein
MAALLMITTLLWLTISTPFVNAFQQQQETCANAHIPDDAADDAGSPFGNNTEEKTESGSLNFSEYLHHIHELIHLSGSLHKHNCSHNFSVYVAFHGELLCPPPNFILS